MNGPRAPFTRAESVARNWDKIQIVVFYTVGIEYKICQ